MSGETLLLHQGLGQGSWAWRYAAPVLAQHFRTILFDTRGTGRSYVPDERYGIADLAHDAAEVLDGRAAHVIGFSMGGYVALTLALEHPELVRSLVLAGTGAGGPNRVPRPAHVREAFEAAMSLPPEEQRRATLPYTFASGWAETNASASTTSSPRRSSTRLRRARSRCTRPPATASTTKASTSSKSTCPRSSSTAAMT